MNLCNVCFINAGQNAAGSEICDRSCDHHPLVSGAESTLGLLPGTMPPVGYRSCMIALAERDRSRASDTIRRVAAVVEIRLVGCSNVHAVARSSLSSPARIASLGEQWMLSQEPSPTSSVVLTTSGK